MRTIRNFFVDYWRLMLGRPLLKCDNEADDVARYIANAKAQDAEISASEVEFMAELRRRSNVAVPRL